MTDIKFGDHRILLPPCADVVGLVASSGQDFQQALGQFTAECEAAGMSISTSKSEAMVSTGKRWLACFGLWVGFLPQVREFKYLDVLFMSEGRIE